MSLLRKVARRGYTHVSNELCDVEGLSFRARGIALVLLSKPDDWVIKIPYLVSIAKEGEEAVRTALHELAEYGFMMRDRERDELGRLRTVTLVADFPAFIDIGTTESRINGYAPGVTAPEGLPAETDLAVSGTSVSTDLAVSERSVSRSSVNRQVIISTDLPITDQIVMDDDDPGLPNALWACWKEEIKTPLTARLKKSLQALADECGAERVIRAIVRAVEYEHREFAYVATVARNDMAQLTKQEVAEKARREEYAVALPAVLPVIVAESDAEQACSAFEKPAATEEVGVWGQVLVELKRQMPVATFDAWVAGCFVLEEGEDRFVIGVPNRYGLDWLEQRLANTVRRTLGSMLGRSVAVSFKLAQGAV